MNDGYDPSWSSMMVGLKCGSRADQNLRVAGLKFILALSSACLVLASLDNGVTLRAATERTVGKTGRMNLPRLKVSMYRPHMVLFAGSRHSIGITTACASFAGWICKTHLLFWKRTRRRRCEHENTFGRQGSQLCRDGQSWALGASWLYHHYCST